MEEMWSDEQIQAGIFVLEEMDPDPDNTYDQIVRAIMKATTLVETQGLDPQSAAETALES